MSKIIPYCKMQGMDLDTIVDTIFENNVNSKDLAKWSKDKLKNNIKKFYVFRCEYLKNPQCVQKAFCTIIVH